MYPLAFIIHISSLCPTSVSFHSVVIALIKSSVWSRRRTVPVLVQRSVTYQKDLQLVQNHKLYLILSDWDFRSSQSMNRYQKNHLQLDHISLQLYPQQFLNIAHLIRLGSIHPFPISFTRFYKNVPVNESLPQKRWELGKINVGKSEVEKLPSHFPTLL